MEVDLSCCIICLEECFNIQTTVRRHFKCLHIVCKTCFECYAKNTCPICEPR